MVKMQNKAQRNIETVEVKCKKVIAD